MSRCSSTVFTVYGIVGLVDDGSTFGSPQALMMSGARAPPAPPGGNVATAVPARALVRSGARARPPMAASVDSTKPDSLIVSVWMVTCTSYLSATLRQLSIAVGGCPPLLWGLLSLAAGA